MSQAAFIRSLLGHTAVTPSGVQQHPVGFGGPPPNIQVVPIPIGYRRATAKEITKPVLKFAQTALKHATPVGKKQTATITNPDKTQKLVMALTEVHWDNHPPRPKLGFKAYEGPEFLHPGISILVADFKPAEKAKFNPFPTRVPGFPTTSSENIYAGDDLTEVIFRKALVSNNLQAVLAVAQIFHRMGEHARAQLLMQRLQVAA